MNRIAIISLLMVMCTMLRLEGQSSQINFSGDFQDVPFTEFAEDVEQQTGISFFFREAWVRGIRVTVSGTDSSLQRTLDRVLLPAGISYYIDEWGQVYLTDQMALVSRLPEYLSGTDHTGGLYDTDGEEG
ncbi:MAG: STN domain-containing protein, partial [Bacteroidales bacterium]|nr:STN domain-containing protein [Bacteroidales bacterium]